MNLVRLPRFLLPLILRSQPEYPVAYPQPLPGSVVAVPFTPDGAFDDFARERKLPDCAVSFLFRAGIWSARASKSGFVPSTMHAEFSDDPDQAVRKLIAAGAVRRVKAGVRINESPYWTLVNEKDVTRDAEREEAEVARKRELERTRKQRQRDRDKAEREARVSAGVTPVSRETSAGVPPEKTAKRKKPQVKGNAVPRDIGVTSRGTEAPSRARARQDDFDFELDQGLVSQSSAVDAGVRARGNSDAELIDAVIEAVAERGHFGLDRATALTVGMSAVARRKAGPPTDRARYASTVIANEIDLYAKLLRGIAPPLAEILAEPRLPPEYHPFASDGGPEPTCVTCKTKKSNYRHEIPEQAVAI